MLGRRPRRAVHRARLGLLGAECQRGQHVRAKIDGQHLQRGQRHQREADEGRDQDGGELSQVVAEQINQEAPDVLVHGAPEFHCVGDVREGIVEEDHHQAARADVGAVLPIAAPHAGSLQCRPVVGSVSGDRDHLSCLFQGSDDPQLALGPHPGEHQMVVCEHPVPSFSSLMASMSLPLTKCWPRRRSGCRTRRAIASAVSP